MFAKLVISKAVICWAEGPRRV